MISVPAVSERVVVIAGVGVGMVIVVVVMAVMVRVMVAMMRVMTTVVSAVMPTTMVTTAAVSTAAGLKLSGTESQNDDKCQSQIAAIFHLSHL